MSSGMVGWLRLSALSLFLAFASTGYATPLTIGYLSFDAGIPAGLNSFSLANRTGAGTGCDFSFPSCTELSITGTLTVHFDGAPSEVRTLSAPLGAGFHQPPEFEFDPSLLPLSASFSGTVTPLSIQLAGGAAARINGSVTGAVDLTADTFLLLTVDAETQAIPEPASASLAVVGLVWLLRRRLSLFPRVLRL